jgi:chemotaxis protein CheD
LKIIVDVGDMKVSRNGDELVTHALGSCLGLTLWDPVAKVGGLLHAMLPLSKINPEKAQENPYMFVDTGVPALFQAFYQLGGKKERAVIKAAGCGAPLGDDKIFKIGERNLVVLKKLLWKNNLLLAAEDTGGTESRTVYFDISTGTVLIQSAGNKRVL